MENLYWNATNVNDFHTYWVQWNKTHFVYGFDHVQHTVFDYRKEMQTIYGHNSTYDPFSKRFHLVIEMGVGPQRYFLGNFDPIDADNWPCSLFIIDWVS